MGYWCFLIERIGWLVFGWSSRVFFLGVFSFFLLVIGVVYFIEFVFIYFFVRGRNDEIYVDVVRLLV